MSFATSTWKSQSWTKDGYLISTDISLIPVTDLNRIFDSPEFYWGKPLPEACMLEMLQNSLCFGLYKTNNKDLVQTSVSQQHTAQACPLESDKENQAHLSPSLFLGFARCITDYTTFAYLTDVWIDPTVQGNGLGKWLIGCVREVIEKMPHLRRTILFTANWGQSVPFYKRLINMDVVEMKLGQGLALMERKGPGHPNFGREGNSYV